MQFVQMAAGLLPVVAFLGALIVLDSYKLVKSKDLALAIAVGGVSAILALFCNQLIIEATDIGLTPMKRFIAPGVEEALKALWIIYLIRSARVGFMVDAAIFGFAIGAGFALVENVYYLQNVADGGVLLWIVRGFGTAIMHGGTTAVFAIISKELFDSSSSKKYLFFVPGLLLALLIHSTYNHFILPPLISTVVLLVLQPALLMIVFHYSERALQSWLGVGLDAEVELYEIISAGQISETHTGKYLIALKEKFPGAIVADMLCYLRINLELALAAKGLLLGRQAGIKIEIDEDTRAQFRELKYLEKSIGATGMLAIAPIAKISDRDKWQIELLRE